MQTSIQKMLAVGLCFLGLVTASYATATPTTDLTGLLNSIHSMRANFTQTVYDNNGKSIQQGSGSMALERPGKFRWETKKPIPQLIIANDKKIWIYDPDLSQVTIKKLTLTAGDAPALLLSHVNTTIDKDYVITRPGKMKGGLAWFELQPRNSDNNYSHIRLGFSSGEIQEMRLEDHLGHSTQIAFKQTKLNSDLAETLFRFKASSKIDVIDETRPR